LTDLLNRSLSLLSQAAHRPLLARGLRGVEREALRILPDAQLALTPHPATLGSALTHAQITTDYSESLLEFITPAEPDIASALDQLDAIHRFAASELDKQPGGELIWSQSMPCELPQEADIPIAWYGHSHIGMLKHVYRRGLALRYGRTMQCIAGIHYNFSLAEEVWSVLHGQDPSELMAKDYQSERYIATIRNFMRYSWLLMYLFGASPALASHFLRGREHHLDVLSDDTLYLPYATSLRMSDLGYQNDAQAGLIPPYNTMMGYMCSLAQAVRKPYAPYAELGMQREGEWWQINTNVLQIENEYYATIRPKRVIRTGERPLEALCARGIQYIEVRCMDVDPFEPTGISLQTARFLDAFLHFCALDESPLTNEAIGHENADNFARVVKEGRRPGLQLQVDGQARDMKAWGLALLARIAPVAALLDAQRGEPVHAEALAAQHAKLNDVSLTPSAQVLSAMQGYGNSYTQFGLAQAQSHANHFRTRPLGADQRAAFEALAKTSEADQLHMVQAQTGSFDDFIADYRSRTPSELCR
jgi:glutamate--cysteine ligase